MSGNLEFADWLQRFVLPLIAGGDVRVRGPLSMAQLGHLPEEHEVLNQIAAARARVAATLIIDPAPFALDEASLRLAVAVNNLLFFLHPDAEGAFVRGRRLASLIEHTQAWAALPPTRDAQEWMARHTLLHLLFELGREDVRVVFWAGRRDFRGQEPPPRLLAWQKLRRVHEERTRVSVIHEAMANPQTLPLVGALLSASPLTDLLHPTRIVPPLDLRGPGLLLGHRQMARLATARYLELGFDAVAPALCHALFQLYGEHDHVKEGRLATAFLCHLQLVFLLGRTDRAMEELLGELRGTVSGRERQLTDFFGLFCAADRLGLARPADLHRDERLKTTVDRWVLASTELCGRRRIDELTSLVARGLGHPLALAS